MSDPYAPRQPGEYRTYPGHSPGTPQYQPLQQYGYPEDHGIPVTPLAEQRNRAGVVVLSIVLLLLVDGGAYAAVGWALRSNVDAAPEFAGDGGSVGGSTGGSTGTSKRQALTAPEKIGSYRKSADQAVARTMSRTLSEGGIADPFAVEYDDTRSSARSVVVWGGTGDGFISAIGELDGFFRSLDSSVGGGSSQRVPADPGVVGGRAECAKKVVNGVSFAICGWVGSTALLGFMFNGLDNGAAATNMRTLLQAIVVAG